MSDQPPLPTWRWWEAVLVYTFGVIIAGLVVAPFVADCGHGFYLTGFVAEVIPLGVLVGWLQWFHKGWTRVIGFPRRFWKEAGIGVVGGVFVYLIGAVAVGTLLQWIFEAIAGHPVQTPEQVCNVEGIYILEAVLTVIVAAPISEEFFFRGCLFRAIRGRRPYWIAAIGSSALFGLVHWGPDDRSAMPGAWLLVSVMFFVGLGLSYIYERRGNIVASMAAHATFNIIGLLFIIKVL